MSKFTVHDHEAIDRTVEDHLDLIESRLLSRFDGVVAIVLIGGFGRGEGTVDLSDGEVRVMNDYDLLVVFEEFDRTRASVESELKEVGEALAEEIGIRFVDLLPRTTAEFENLSPTKMNYDMQHGYHVVYGDEELLFAGDPIRAEEIPDEEVRKLLFNRLVCALECISVRDGEFRPERSESFAFRQASKACVAAVDSYLLRHDRYVPRYGEKIERLRELDPSTDLVDLARTAIQVKLDSTTLPALDPVEFWMEVRREYEVAFMEFFEEYYQMSIPDWGTFVDHELSSVGIGERFRVLSTPDLSYAERIDQLLRPGSATETGAFVTQVPILFAVDPRTRSIDDRLLARAVELLRIDGDPAGPGGWDTVRAAAVENWYSVVHD